ncbi:MAG: flavin reductase [Pseudomonadota bacterium]
MVDAKTFRDAMSRLAASVSVVTSNGPGGLSGCTASAVCSVSDEPPILLVCINRSSRNNAVFKQNGLLCINVLRATQQDIAEVFARSLGDSPASARFDENVWSLENSGVSRQVDLTDLSTAPVKLPALNDALISLDCRITDTAEIGTHTVFYCAVETARFGDQSPALLYFERIYQTSHRARL